LKKECNNWSYNQFYFCGVEKINFQCKTLKKMKLKITVVGLFLILGLFKLNAQNTCSEDRVAYVNSKNVGPTGSYILSIGSEEKASQTYHYAGPGKVSGARIYGTVPSIIGVVLKVSLYAVDGNNRPTGSALSTAPNQYLFAWSSSYFDVSFSPAIAVSSDFAIVVEILNTPGWGHNFALKYTGNGEGLGEDLASLAGTSSGFNWASAMTAYNKDGDLYIYPRMISFNTPSFTSSANCNNINVPILFSNTSQFTKASMLNKITNSGYAGANFLYSWNFGDSTAISHTENPIHTFSTVGVYSVSLTTSIEGWDGVCSQTFTSSVSIGLSITASSLTNITCNGGNNGTIVALGSGGALPYSYSLIGTSYQTSPTFNNLIAGNYILKIKDANNCYKETNLTLTEPASISFSTISNTNASCGKSDGGIFVVATGGVNPIQYKLNTGAYQTTGTFSGLAAGSYNITAKDSNGCIFSSFVIVNDFGGPTFTSTSGTNVSCNGISDGSITLASNGGTGAIQYSINGGNSFQNSGIFGTIAAGTYSAMVKDAAGCTDIQNITINQPRLLTFDANSLPLSCFQSNDGIINISNVSGGTGVIKFSINGLSYQSGSSFTGLSAGTYTVYAKDVVSCIKLKTVTIIQPTSLSASVTAINASCNNSQDGSLTIVGSGATSNYTYSIGIDNVYQNSGIFNNLSSGNYTLTVKDTKGCRYTTSRSITQPTAVLPVATPTNSTCGNSNGGMLVTATGGSGIGYTYSLNGGAFGTGSLSLLAAGTYVVTAKDGAGCVTSINVTIADLNGPTIVSASHTNVGCSNGTDGSITIGTITGGTGLIQYSINGTVYQTSNFFNNLPAGNYNVTVKDAVGCVGITSVIITQPVPFVITTENTNVLCNGSYTGRISLQVGGGSGTLAYSYNGGSTFQSSKVFNNLNAGNYWFIVKDAAGCVGITSTTITEPTTITINKSTLNVSCFGSNNGAIYAFANGGVGALQYSLNGILYQNSGIFTNLSGGNFVVYVKDANNCVVTSEISINEPSQLVASSTVSNVTCAGGNNGVVVLTVSGGLPSYSYLWSNGSITEDVFNLKAGAYNVNISDINGCFINKSFIISQPLTPLIVNGTVTNSNGTNGRIDITPTGGVGNYTFIWSNGLTVEDISGLVPGNYTVVVTDANGCATSSTFVVALSTSINSIELSNSINIYPNPANNNLTINSNNFKLNKIEIIDILGKTIYTDNVNNESIEINTTNFSEGAYFVKILVDGSWTTKKFLIIK